MTKLLFLKEDVFFCVSEGQGIFLDLIRDAYSAVPLPDNVLNERGCLCEHKLTVALDPHRADLINAQLVSETAGRSLRTYQGIRRPTSHLLAPIDDRAFGSCRDDEVVRTGICDFKDFLFAARRASDQLKKRHIRETVHAIRDRKRAAGIQENDISCLKLQTRIFRSLRPWHPRPYLCLFEALALLEFLARRDLFPTWVFGVQAKPFGAHCWVQDGGHLLDEAREYADQFTPIMAV